MKLEVRGQRQTGDSLVTVTLLDLKFCDKNDSDSVTKKIKLKALKTSDKKIVTNSKMTPFFKDISFNSYNNASTKINQQSL